MIIQVKRDRVGASSRKNLSKQSVTFNTTVRCGRLLGGKHWREARIRNALHIKAVDCHPCLNQSFFWALLGFLRTTADIKLAGGCPSHYARTTAWLLDFLHFAFYCYHDYYHGFDFDTTSTVVLLTTRTPSSVMAADGSFKRPGGRPVYFCLPPSPSSLMQENIPPEGVSWCGAVPGKCYERIKASNGA